MAEKKEVETVKKEIDVAKEANEIGVAIAKILVTSNSALEDGFQAGQDIPTVLMGSYKELTDAIEGSEKVLKEFKSNPVESASGLVMPILEAVQAIRKKAKVAEVKGNVVSVKK
ncbi:MAG: hypothetical protein CL529_12705 [Aequorivita sp.]|nr:hypothetical protein [Aequorivita sp.]|tara:strand:+ start:19199 stop:19540 length:342 start_codon:yes stop_codon:yes gene_type:complete